MPLALTALVASVVAMVGEPAAAVRPTECLGRPVTIWGTSGHDRLRGTPGPDVIHAGRGYDRVLAGGGNDRICGGPGIEVLRGGSGADHVSAGCGDCFDPNGESTLLVGGKGRDVLVGSDEWDILLGGRGADRIDGGGSLYIELEPRDRIEGGAGKDVLIGGRRTSIEGGIGNDDITAQRDVSVDPGPGDDTISGPDSCCATLDLSDAPGPVTVDLAADVATGDGTDRFENVDNVLGTPFPDALSGDDDANRLEGGDGDDMFQGRGGDDSFYAGPGDDLIDGASGEDTIYYVSASGPVNVSLAAGTGSGEGNDGLVDIENIYGSAFDDVLTGNDVANAIDSGDGIDEIVGGDGDDVLELHGDGGTIDAGAGDDALSSRFVSQDEATLAGGSGDDHLIGGRFDESFDGGPGRDTIDFTRDFGDGVTVDLIEGTASGLGNGEDSLVSIEDVIGTSWADVLRGDDGPNRLVGREYNDELYGRGGDDTLDGGDDRTEDGDLGDGGDGNDTCIAIERQASCEA